MSEDSEVIILKYQPILKCTKTIPPYLFLLVLKGTLTSSIVVMRSLMFLSFTHDNCLICDIIEVIFIVHILLSTNSDYVSALSHYEFIELKSGWAWE